MAPYNLSEKEYRVALKAALVIDAVRDALDAMTGIAARLIDRELTTEAVNILTYVRSNPDVHHETFDYADEMYMVLEETLCPRVMQDAREFILSKTLRTMANYIDTIEAAD
ncbi:MAG: hypothetical protein CL610_12640 [Anaerolineaceae bacterium]|nr:hypothetical protein [Anaerolineaceae bacterium]